MKSLSAIQEQIARELKNVIPHINENDNTVIIRIYEREKLINFCLDLYKLGLAHGKIKETKKIAMALLSKVRGSYIHEDY
jgi:hypothetical protein